MIVDSDIWNQSFPFFDVVQISSCQYAAILSCVCGTKQKRFWKIQVKKKDNLDKGWSDRGYI